MKQSQRAPLRLVAAIISVLAILVGLAVEMQSPPAYAMSNHNTLGLLSGTLDVQVSQSSDDAEEAVQTGTVVLTSSDLELVNDPDGTFDQVVGIRFANIDIPSGATILQAHLLLTADETSAIETSLAIYGEAVDNAPTFESTPSNISQRLTTNAVTQWTSLPEWSTIEDVFQSPDLSAVVYEIVNRPGWQQNNALVLILSGTGRRTAFAYDGYKIKAPMLHVEWRLDSTPTATDTSTPTATATTTFTPTATATVTPTTTATMIATATVAPSATATITPTATSTATAMPTATTTVIPTATATITPTATVMVPPTATVTITPTATATPEPSLTAAPQCNRTGGAVRSIWFGITGSFVGDLTRYVLFPDEPDLVQIVNKLETPRNLDDNYGERVQGYLCPPQSGDYTIWIAGDDQSQIWLSTDNSPKNSVLVAFVPSWTRYQEWDKFPEQKSLALTLQAEQAYYFEVLHKDSISDDSLSIAWKGPGLAQQVISGRYLAPYADNTPTLENRIFLPLVNR